ncbi:hypothetical protein RhiTH_011647 [Rhizoctonia solani]
MSSNQNTASSSAAFVTSASRDAAMLRRVSPMRHSALFEELVQGIASTRNVFVMSGDAAMAGSGLATAEGGSGNSYWDMIRNATQDVMNLSEDQLARYNRVMALRRIKARSANRNRYIDYLERLASANSLAGCVTASIDGLEGRWSANVAAKVTGLYGDNSCLRCLTSSCQGLGEAATKELDDIFTNPPNLKPSGDDPRICKDCARKDLKNNKLRRSGNNKTRSLRPSVQSRVALSFIPVEIPDYDDPTGDYVDDSAWEGSKVGRSKHARGKGKEKIVEKPEVIVISDSEDSDDSDPSTQPALRSRRRMKKHIELTQTESTPQFYDGEAYLFLLVGPPPQDPEVLHLVHAFADSVHSRAGAVICLSEVPLPGTKYDYIDFQLENDINLTFGEILRAMDQMAAMETYGSAPPRLADSDLWFELLRRDVSVRQTEKETSYEGQLCGNCGCSITEYLARCTECSALYCHRQEDNDSEDDDPEESDFGNDDFAYHDACLIFDFFSQEGTRSIEDAKESFVCPDCWDHHKDGLYPHFVKPMCRDSVELRTSKWPRLVMVVYYLQEFWPQTQHLITMTSGLWKQLGWEFQGFSVRLQHLQDRSDVTAQLQWEAGSFQFMAVFITHGLTGDQGYQLDDSEAVPPLNLLQLTLTSGTNCSWRCQPDLGVFLCLRSSYDEPDHGVNCFKIGDEEQRTLVACLNKKLSPVYMFNWLNKATKALAEEPDEVQRTLRLSWLRDSIAPSHSDLLFMSNGHAAEMWLYAPFQSRPLGRPLPSLLSVCPCSSEGKNQRRKKIWKVDHNGKSGKQLCDVEVKAICRACRQKWPLPQEDMKGILVKVNGVYAAIVPYFS